MFIFYQLLTVLLTPFLWVYLKWRSFNGKEVPERLKERFGVTNLSRPQGPLIWLHAASVGEAQAGLTMIEKINAADFKGNWLITTGTVTSAKLIKSKNINNLQHQFIPLDHPLWVQRFLQFWQPDLALWLESEIWPNLIRQTSNRKTPLILVNARLSDKSYANWQKFKFLAHKIFPLFTLILTQSDLHTQRFKNFHATAQTTGNIKLATAPLAFNETDLNSLQQSIKNRPLWLYASSHKGEEELAARIHDRLKDKIPDILTIIVPRHPERGETIETQLNVMGMNITRRTDNKILPEKETDIYLADTLGELGLFYKLSPMAVIGRSFSHDGGGGHNPIEAAQLDCAIFTGPHIQFQTLLFDPLFESHAAKQVQSEEKLYQSLLSHLTNADKPKTMVQNAHAYLQSVDHNIAAVLSAIKPYLPLRQSA